MSKPKFVYFIKPIGMDGPIKIGSACDPERRLATLGTWSPFSLEMMGKVAGNSSDEVFLHRRFADLHTHREWFLSSPLLRQTITRILDGETIEKACEELPVISGIRNRKKPAPTPERQLFVDYGRRLKKAYDRKHDKIGCWYQPHDVRAIMDAWRGDYLFKKPISPTEEQIARLEEVIAAPIEFGIFIKWGDYSSILRDAA